MASILGRVDMCSGAGLVYGARVFSPVQMVLDAELMELIAQFAEGYDFDEDHLAVQVIEDVVSNKTGHFLGEEHTMRHMRDFFYPQYFDRQMWEDWEAAGKPRPEDKARERIAQILEEHEPEPLAEDVDAEFTRIVAALDKKVREEDEDWD